MNNKNLKKYFHPLELAKKYKNKIRYKNTVGNDKINNRLFKQNYRKTLYKSYEKITINNYKFTSYREKLILKGRGKEPRIISIPTIRDKIVLTALKDYIFEKYNNYVDTNLVQTKIAELKEELSSKKYDTVIRLDIVKYYDSIHHDILMKLLSKKIKDKRVLCLIEKAIKNATVTSGVKPNTKNSLGIPQGLPISNILSAIYLMNVDKKFNNDKNISYFRYVDDILILCKKEDKDKISKEIREDLSNQLGLKIHENDKNGEKSYIKDIKEGFSYLGYVYVNDKFSIREGTIKRFEKGIEELFNNYRKDKDKNIDEFLLRLNIKITGIVTEEKEKYGWLFFFSQIEDKRILFHLDNLIKKFLKKYKIPELGVKKFSRSYHEIIYNLRDSNYLYKMENITKEEKIEVLKFKLTKEEIIQLKENEHKINYEYKRIMNTIITGLERDIQNFS